MDADGQIVDFEEKPMMAHSNIVSTGIYVIRRRKLIELLEQCNEEGRYNFVTDILVRYKGMKKIYGYMIDTYWSNIASVEAYYQDQYGLLEAGGTEFLLPRRAEDLLKGIRSAAGKVQRGIKVKNSLIGIGMYHQQPG